MATLQDLISQAESQKQEQADEQKEVEQQQAQLDANKAVLKAIDEATQSLIAFQSQHQPRVSVTNQKLPTTIKTPDIQGVVDSLKSLEKAVNSTKPDNTELIASLGTLNTSIKELPKSIEFPEAPEPVEEVTITNQIDYKKDFKGLQDAITSLEVSPKISVPKPQVTIPLTDVLDSLLKVQQAIEGIKIPAAPKIDFTNLQNAMGDVKTTIENIKFPVANYVLPFKDSNGKAAQASLDANGALLPTSLPVAGVMGQTTTTGSATQFASHILTVGVIVQAISTNSASVYVGFSGTTAATGFELQPGQATSTAIDNTNKLYLYGTSGDTVCYIGS